MNILHLLYGGNVGGIEKLCMNLGKYGFETDNNFFLFSHPEGTIFEEMKASGAQVIECYIGKYDFVSLYSTVRKVVMEQKIDFIVLHHAAPLIWMAMLLYLTKRHRAKVIVCCHNEYVRLTQNKVQKEMLFNGILHQCDAIIAISNFVKKSLTNATNIPAEKIKIIYNGTPQRKEKIVEHKQKDGVIHLIYVGRLIREKGVHLLIEAVSMLKADDIVLEIVGDGDDRAELEAMVTRYHLNEKILFRGEQSEIDTYLLNADIFVHPAVWNEAFGITLIEAMSCGLICVAFRKGALAEIIEDGVNGYLIDECSAVALAAKLSNIIDAFNHKRASINEMKRNAIRRSEDFSFDRYIQQLHNLYALLGEQ